MEQDFEKDIAALSSDPDGLLTYEYIANNIATVDKYIDRLVENMCRVDRNGQFSVSAARYLNAINPESFATAIDNLVENAIERDREHRYIATLLPDLWGADYAERAEELAETHRNFRRIYQRVYPKGI